MAIVLMNVAFGLLTLAFGFLAGRASALRDGEHRARATRDSVVKTLLTEQSVRLAKLESDIAASVAQSIKENL